MNKESLSVIIPVFNECDNIPELYSQLQEIRTTYFPMLEIVFVDDGSKDTSTDIISKIAENDKNTKLVVLNKNYGQTIAISAGIKHSNGKIIITMDADLQNDPQDIKTIVEYLEQGYDVVSGWRKFRKDALITRVFPSKIANFLISLITGVYLHDYGCTLKAYRREFVEDLPLYGEMHRFIPAYCSLNGAHIIEIPVNHRQRLYGHSKYGLGRTFKVILDLLVVKFVLSYLSTPMYIFGGIALFNFVIGTFISFVILLRKLLGGEWISPLFFVALLFLSVSIICFLLGILAEIIVRFYYETRKFPPYKIRSKINLI